MAEHLSVCRRVSEWQWLEEGIEANVVVDVNEQIPARNQQPTTWPRQLTEVTQGSEGQKDRFNESVIPWDKITLYELRDVNEKSIVLQFYSPYIIIFNFSFRCADGINGANRPRCNY